MTPEQFTYWMQGFVELNNGQYPNTEQWNMIKEHLKTVFHKVTQPCPQPPSVFDPIIHPLERPPAYDRGLVIC